MRFSVVFFLSLLGAAADATPAAPGNSPLKTVWKLDLEAFQQTAVFGADGVAYIGYRNTVDEANALNGKQIRSFNRGEEESDREILALYRYNQRLLVISDATPYSEEPDQKGSTEFYAWAVDLQSGKTIWQKPVDELREIPASNGMILLPCKDGLALVDLSTGRERWKKPAATPSALAITPAAVFTIEVSRKADSGGLLLKSYSLPDGADIWSAPLGIGLDSYKRLLANDRENVYVAIVIAPPPGNDTAAGKTIVAAFSRETGKPLWRKELPDEEAAGSLVCKDTGIFFATQGTIGDEQRPGHLYAIAASTGETRWKCAISSDDVLQDYTPVIDGEEILTWSEATGSFGEFDVLFINRGNGTIINRQRLFTNEKPMLSRPVVCGETLIVGDGQEVKCLVKNRGKDKGENRK
jgi:outer membrane protein assembly factor BamB